MNEENSPSSYEHEEGYDEPDVEEGCGDSVWLGPVWTVIEEAWEQRGFLSKKEPVAYTAPANPFGCSDPNAIPF